jgi:hypothetical protein
MFGTVVIVIIQSTFHLKIYKIKFFFVFFQKKFDISTSKRFENIIFLF